MAIFQCDLLKNSKNCCIAIATELFFVFFRREKNKHNGASYLFCFTYFSNLLFYTLHFKNITHNKITILGIFVVSLPPV